MNRKPQVRHHFPPAIWARGVAYAKEHRVKPIQCEYSAKESVFNAEVSGSLHVPYEVEIHLVLQKHYTAIQSECTCPMRRDCKHVAAVLFILESENRLLGPLPLSAKEILNYFSQLPQDNNIAWHKWRKSFKNLTEKSISYNTPHAMSSSEELLIYILSPSKKGANQIVLQVKSSRVLKKGDLGLAKAFTLQKRIQEKLNHVDRVLLAKLLGLKELGTQGYYDESLFPLAENEHAELLPQLLSTGRCYWQKAGPGLAPLHFYEQGSGTFSWQFDEHLMQSLQCQVEGEFVELYQIADRLCYIDKSNVRLGFLQSPIPMNQITEWLQMPKIPPDQINEAQLALSEWAHHTKIHLPALQSLETIKEKTLPVTPLLHFYSEEDVWQEGEFEVEIRANLYFCYGSQHINWYDREEEVYTKIDHELIKTPRDADNEEQCIDRLLTYGLSPKLQPASLVDEHLYDFVFNHFDMEKVNQFFLHDVLALRADGWQVTFAEDFPIQTVYEDLPWYAELSPTQENHWFDFEMGVEVDGKKVNLLPALLEYIHAHNITGPLSHKDILIPVSRVGQVQMSTTRFNSILMTLFELYGTGLNHDHLTLTKQRAAFLLDMQHALSISASRWIGWEKLAHLAKVITTTRIETVPIPDNFAGELRDYQHAGLNWLQFLREHDLGGVLADDMGLGKTIQTLVHLQVEKNAGRLIKPSLIVCPTSLLHNWQQEIERFTPELKCIVFHGTDRMRHVESLHCDIIITSYALVLQDKALWARHALYYVVLDEAQAIKNPRSRSSLVIQQLNAQHRLCLTGTPMENHLGDLWSLFHFLMPGFLGTQQQFNIAFRTPIEKRNDDKQRALLVQRTKPFILRRTKAAVAQELPSKITMIQSIELSQPQRDLYESIRLALEHKVRQAIDAKGFGSSQIVILDALLKLRQVCCDPRVMHLTQAATITEPVKLNWLLDTLPNLLEEGRRILLFSTFKTVLMNIAQTLQEHRIRFSLLTGDTKDRKAQIAAFQNK